MCHPRGRGVAVKSIKFWINCYNTVLLVVTNCAMVINIWKLSASYCCITGIRINHGISFQGHLCMHSGQGGLIILSCGGALYPFCRPLLSNSWKKKKLLLLQKSWRGKCICGVRERANSTLKCHGRNRVVWLSPTQQRCLITRAFAYVHPYGTWVATVCMCA